MASDLSRLNMAQNSSAVAERQLDAASSMQTDYLYSLTESSRSRSDHSAACSMQSQEGEVSSLPPGDQYTTQLLCTISNVIWVAAASAVAKCKLSTGASSPGGYPARHIMSPRQKSRARTSPLKAAGVPYPNSPRLPAATLCGHHPGRLSRVGLEAREKLPPSPSDSNAAKNLRRTALLRCVLQKREVIH